MESECCASETCEDCCTHQRHTVLDNHIYIGISKFVPIDAEKCARVVVDVRIDPAGCQPLWKSLCD